MFAYLLILLLSAALLAANLLELNLIDAVEQGLLYALIALSALGFFISKKSSRKSAQQLTSAKDLLASLDALDEIKAAEQNEMSCLLAALSEQASKLKTRAHLAECKSEYLREALRENASNLRNINRALNFLSAENAEQIKELIKSHNRASIQTIAERGKLAFSYSTHYDEAELPRFSGRRCALLLANPLESFVLANILRQQGMEAREFSALSNFEEFDLIITDEGVNLSSKNVLKISDSSSRASLQRPYDRIGFLKAAGVILSAAQGAVVRKSSEKTAAGALIFLQNELLSSQLLHEANKHAATNKTAASISTFKRLLAEDFKLIAISHHCIMYDYEAIKSLINAAKLRNPELYVIVLTGGEALKESFDFADQIFKNSAQSTISNCLKKHL